MVQAVQRKFTKRLRGCKTLTKERLALLDLVTVYKILSGLIDIDFNDYFAFKKDGATGNSSGHNYCLVESNGRADARCNYFAVRIIKPWNSLPEATIKFNSLASLKRTLSSIDMP